MFVGQISNFLTQLIQKIAGLSNKQFSLHNFISSKYAVSDQHITQRAGPTSNVLDIINEMAGRDLRKNNIVVYNFHSQSVSK